MAHLIHARGCTSRSHGVRSASDQRAEHDHDFGCAIETPRLTKQVVAAACHRVIEYTCANLSLTAGDCRANFLFQGGELGWRENRIADRRYYWTAFLALGARCNPGWIRGKGREFLFAIIQRIPFQDVVKVGIRFADRYRPEAYLLDAVLCEQRNGRGLETRQQGGQPTRYTMINSQFV